MSFVQWIEKFAEEESSLGDLSRDISCDGEFPEVDSRQAWLKHLESLGACGAALETFRRAWWMYTKGGQFHE